MNQSALAVVPHTEPTQTLAKMLKASGDPLRLEILRALSRDSFGVLELAEIFDIKQSGMSHHLKVLAQAGLVSTRKEGNSVFYRRKALAKSDALYLLKQSLFEEVDKLVLSDAVTSSINFVYSQRAKTSEIFFSNHAAQFKAQQEMIAAFEVYGELVSDRLLNTTLPNQKLALEIGPGAGEFIPVLAAQFDQVIALDNNKALLDGAQKNNRQINNVAYVHRDTQFCQEHAQSVDCIVANMVLHHTPSPRQIFEDVSFALTQGGVFIVCDLTQHDQDWARTTCGDQWLGFDPSELNLWAQDNQLTEGQSDYVALRNGFQIQIRQFIKN